MLAIKKYKWDSTGRLQKRTRDTDYSGSVIRASCVLLQIKNELRIFGDTMIHTVEHPD